MAERREVDGENATKRLSGFREQAIVSAQEMPGSRKGQTSARESGSGTEAPTCRILLVDEAHIVARGEALRVWFVALGQGWVKACEHPAVIPQDGPEMEDGLPPGTVWRRATEISVPLGTLIMSRATQPNILRLDPLAYLVRGKVATERRVVETLYRATGNYRIEVVQDSTA